MVVNCTQCARGVVTDAYAAGRALKDAGVVPGFDLTLEAAIAKLSWLLGQEGYTPSRVREEMQRSLRGELTAPRDERFSAFDRTLVAKVARVLTTSDVFTDEEGRQLGGSFGPIMACSAAARGDVEELRMLLASGLKLSDMVDYDGRTAMHLAACNGRAEVLQFLLGSGMPAAPVDRWGGTPLSDAVEHGHETCASMLKGAGASLDQSGSDQRGSKRLFELAAKGDATHVRRMLAHGTSPNVCDYDRRTPLHVAAAEGHSAVAAALLDFGADAYARDRWNLTPADDAIKHGDPSLISLLRSPRTPARTPDSKRGEDGSGSSSAANRAASPAEQLTESASF